MVLNFIFLYISLSVLIGLYFSRKTKTADDFIRAGRNLPFLIVFAMVFATWFGAETVLGISATFLEEGLIGLASDPFGAAACLIIFGLFFAKKLYRMNLFTLGDYFRKKYNRHIELTISALIIISYLGWIAAQITALGLVFSLLSNDSISNTNGILLGAFIVLCYTVIGGMWSIAATTFLQMIVIIVGLVFATAETTSLAGGIGAVITKADLDGKLLFLPSIGSLEFLFWIAAFLTMALGSIPQQDVFQRANAAQNASIASVATTFGGIFYLIFASVPLLLAYTSFIIDPLETSKLMEIDSQLVLPSLILNHTSSWLQVIFFGSLVSVILSTASGTLLAPSVLFTQNIVSYFSKKLEPHQLMMATRITIFVFVILVCMYSISSNDTIHTMVENAYRVTLAGAFTPLVAGLFWKRANSSGAGLAIVLGVSSWLALELLELNLPIEPQLIGLLLSIVGMILGSVVLSKSSVRE